MDLHRPRETPMDHCNLKACAAVQAKRGSLAVEETADRTWLAPQDEVAAFGALTADDSLAGDSARAELKY